jgi:DNA invertase Pin-like site-specific DNA recombinase
MILAVFLTINSGTMANRKTDMSKPRQILRLFSQGEKKLKISTLTGVSRNTLKKYFRIYQGLDLSIKLTTPFFQTTG